MSQLDEFLEFVQEDCDFTYKACGDGANCMGFNCIRIYFKVISLGADLPNLKTCVKKRLEVKEKNLNTILFKTSKCFRFVINYPISNLPRKIRTPLIYFSAMVCLEISIFI